MRRHLTATRSVGWRIPRLDVIGHDGVVTARLIPVQEVLRYAQGASRIEIELDGYLNYHFLTAAPTDAEAPRLMLEAGINPAAMITGPHGARRPVIGIRSSPWKAGQTSNPWHDEFDLDHGHIRYYGDHKPTTDRLSWRDGRQPSIARRLVAARGNHCR